MNKQKFIMIDQQRKDNAGAFLDSLPANGKYEVIFQPYKTKRSLKQNASLIGVAYPAIMHEMGDRGGQAIEELHEYWCGEYFGWVHYEVINKTKAKPFRTTTRNQFGKRDLIGKSEMADFYSFVQQKMAEFGVIVPDPIPNEIR